MKTNDPAIEFEESSGNIFADLGMDDADELFTRAQIGFCVFKFWKKES